MVSFRAVIMPISSLLLGVTLLVLGNGLQGALLGLRAGLEGMNEESIGLFMSAFFAGYAAGSLLVLKPIRQVGHIRVFAALASLASIISLLHILFISPWLWTLFRVIYGICFAGLILVTESWLNSATDSKLRGRVLAIYGIVILLGMGASPLILNLAKPDSFVPFMVVSILLSLALVPVTLSQVRSPEMEASSRLSLKKLYRTSPTGIAGILCVGLYLGAFYGMAPTFAQQIGFDVREITLFLGLPAAGALFLQWPLGWLSDRINRQFVILLSFAGTACICLLLADINVNSPRHLYLLAFLFGGLAFPAYSLCIALTNDYLLEEDILPAASGLILVYGVGAACGPFLASLAMDRIGPGGLFFSIAGVVFLFLVFEVLHLPRRKPILPILKETLIHLPLTTHIIYRLDKRSSHEQADDEANKPTSQQTH